MICEHQQTSVLCDKCAILALVKQNAALKEHIATAQTLLDSAHNFQYLKACEQARDKAEKLNAAIASRDRLAALLREVLPHISMTLWEEEYNMKNEIDEALKEIS